MSIEYCYYCGKTVLSRGEYEDMCLDCEELEEDLLDCPYKDMTNQIIQGDCLTELKKLLDESIDCIITSPPYYGLRDYGVEGQLGLEKTLEEYLEKMFLITAELKRVLKKTGTIFWNHGDSYGSGSGAGVRGGKQATNRGTQTNKGWQKSGKSPIIGYEKSLLLQNFRLVQRMIDEQQLILRNVLIWHKPNCMPSSVKDRFTVDFEPVFFFSKSKKYWFEQQFESYAESSVGRYKLANSRSGVEDAAKIKGDLSKPRYKRGQGTIASRGDSIDGLVVGGTNPLGRTKRAVWKIPTQPFKEAHFATFPEALIEPMIKAGCPEAGIVLDPFMGSGTVAVVAKKLKRDWLGIELNKSYIDIAEARIKAIPTPLL